MTESDRIAEAEKEITDALAHANGPVTSGELSARLTSATPKSLVRLAIQRMIGRGTVTYDGDRRYSLPRDHQPQT